MADNVEQRIIPARTGLMHRKVTFPFKAPPFHNDMLRQVSRRGKPEPSPVAVRVRKKRTVPIGVYNTFARG